MGTQTVYEWMPDNRTWQQIDSREHYIQLLAGIAGQESAERLAAHGSITIYNTAFRKRTICEPYDLAEEIAVAEALGLEFIPMGEGTPHRDPLTREPQRYPMLVG